ncbi:hypothetical protein KC952_04260, partial [Candidatus Saccharibacteria bacterium]|nr:hypothetical protein [Candidatus Saccharibacteria bacterium]
KLIAKIRQLGINVDIIDQKPNTPDMVFTTDQGIIMKDSVLLANFHYSERQQERVYYRKWFRNHGFRLRSLSDTFSLEGGDALFFRGQLLVGTGFRTSPETCSELNKRFDIDTIGLELIDSRYYHLDTCLLVIDDKTIFYYPPAFSKSSIARLKDSTPVLLELSHEEAAGYAANSFISGKNAVIQSGLPSFIHKLHKLDILVHEVDVSEFNKAGGGIHCLINILEMESK